MALAGKPRVLKYETRSVGDQAPGQSDLDSEVVDGFGAPIAQGYSDPITRRRPTCLALDSDLGNNQPSACWGSRDDPPGQYVLEAPQHLVLALEHAGIQRYLLTNPFEAESTLGEGSDLQLTT